MDIKEDKIKHFFFSLILTLLLGSLIGLLPGALITFLIGGNKEIYDKLSGRGCAEWADLFADVAGIVCAAVGYGLFVLLTR